MENQILEAISLVKNRSKKRATTEEILNHIFQTSASIIAFAFVNQTVKHRIAKNKIDDNFKITEDDQIGNLSEFTDEEVQVSCNDDWNEIQEWNPTTNQFSRNIDQTSLISLEETPRKPLLNTPCSSFGKRYPYCSAEMNVIKEQTIENKSFFYDRGSRKMCHIET